MTLPVARICPRRDLAGLLGLVAICLLWGLPWLASAQAEPAAPASAEVLEVFVREGCPHCAAAKVYLREFAAERPWLHVELRPIAVALSAHVLASRVLAMDETPIKAGREKKGKMREAYLWPIYGEDDEVVFHYAPSREHRHVETFLAGFCGTLLTDGYAAYTAYAAHKDGITHSNCWAHYLESGFIRSADFCVLRFKIDGVCSTQDKKERLTLRPLN